MKTLYAIILILNFVISANAQKICNNGTLALTFNTSDTVWVTLNTVYVSTPPTVTSTKWGNDGIALTKTGTVNSNKPGVYTECYKATDNDGLIVECCRTVVVLDKGGVKAGVNTNQYAKIQLYPNPLNGNRLTIIGDAVFKGGTIKISIFAINGELIIFENLVNSDDLTIELPSNVKLKPGVYLIQIGQNEEFVQTKFLVL